MTKEEMIEKTKWKIHVIQTTNNHTNDLDYYQSILSVLEQQQKDEDIEAEVIENALKIKKPCEKNTLDGLFKNIKKWEFEEEVEEIDFVQEHKKIPVTLNLEPCDTISREAVREFVERIQTIKDSHNENGTPINYGTICDLVIQGWKLMKLPSVQPICEEREKGECPWYAE